MDHRLVVLALLAFTGFQVIEAGRYGKTTTTTTVIPPEDEDPPVTVFIPLPVSFNLTTQWLGVLRDSYTRITTFESSQRLQNARQVANNVRLMSQPYKREMDSLAVNVVEKDRSCVEKNTEMGLQVLSTVDEELKSCSQPLIDMIEAYDNELDQILKEVNAQDEATIYTKCLPTEARLTKKILDRAEKCFRKEYLEAMDSIYYPTGLQLFNVVTEKAMTFVNLETAANTCGIGVISAHEQILAEKLEGVRRCATAVALPGYAPNRREKRGFGKKLKKGWKKIRNGVKKLCNRVPCRVGYSIPIPGK